MKRTGWLCLILFVCAGCGATRATRMTRATPEVNLLSMGDIAQVGPGQARVAAALERHVAASPRRYNALFTAGDNFYMKLSGVDDPKWRTLFEDLYNPAVLNFPFYIALGNHDYDKLEGGGFKWQIEMEYSR